MGKLHKSQQDLALECRGGEDEEDAKWAVDRACNYVNEGKFERAFSLLEKAERLYPNVKGLPEIVAVTEVCYAATWNPCACSLKPQQQNSPDWYRILKVSEKADLNAIKKRYRQLALLLHPDKNKHVRAEEAFKLVSEAYAHLSDKNKRAVFDLEWLKRRCKRCSSVARMQRDTDASMKGYRERLKGKNYTSSQKCHFGSEFHSAEWNMEHEKLKMFRERARAKVDSLAQILRERRSRWNEEAGTAREKYQSKKADKKTGSSHWGKEGQFTDESELLEQIRQRIKARNEPMQEVDGSFARSANPKLSEIIEERGFSFVAKDLLEQLRGRKILQRDTPQVLQSLDGLLGILREEFGGNSSTVRGEHMEASTKYRNRTRQGLDAETIETNIDSSRDERSVGSGQQCHGFAGESNSAKKHMEACPESRDRKRQGLNAETADRKIDSSRDERSAGSGQRCDGFAGESNSAVKQQQSVHKVDEESIVIDDFLAGLGDCPPERYQRSSATSTGMESNLQEFPSPLPPQRSKLSTQNSSSSKTRGLQERGLFEKTNMKHESSIKAHMTARSSSDKDEDWSSFRTAAKEIFRQSSAGTQTYGNSFWESLSQQKENLIQKAAAEKDRGATEQNVNVISNPVPAFVKTQGSRCSTSLNASLEFTTNSGADCVIKIPIVTSKASPRAAAVVDKERDTRPFSEESDSLNDYGHRKVTVDAHSHVEDSTDMEQTILQSQKQKSEQLLKTLERLRDETRSVAATLEKIKNSVGPETHHVGGMFSGNCHIPTASMVAT